LGAKKITRNFGGGHRDRAFGKLDQATAPKIWGVGGFGGWAFAMRRKEREGKYALPIRKTARLFATDPIAS
jgi:hypothetical protein